MSRTTLKLNLTFEVDVTEEEARDFLQENEEGDIEGNGVWRYIQAWMSTTWNHRREHVRYYGMEMEKEEDETAFAETTV